VASAGSGTAGPDPVALERDAHRAERQERWEDAVRLRFRAGLLRLGARREDLHPDMTPNHVVARRLGSEPLERLSARFDEIVYGAADATAEDAEAQRRDWPEILRGGGEG